MTEFPKGVKQGNRASVAYLTGADKQVYLNVNTESLRKMNCAIILTGIRRYGPSSHTDMHRWSGMSSATISAVTAQLEDEGIILRKEVAPKAGRGRPRVLFDHSPDHAYVVAARITFDTVEYSLIDYCGALKDRFAEKRSVEPQGPEEFAKRFRAGLHRLCERSGLAASSIKVISITTKGLVSRHRSELVWSPVFGGKAIDFDALLSPDWPAKKILTNETRYAAQAIAVDNLVELQKSATNQIATLSLDHSIGLGIATIDYNGRVSSVSPPFGHMVHHAGGSLCRCGSRGCIEAYAGFYGILRTAFEVPEDTIPAKFVPAGEIAKVAQNARSGDRRAQYAFRNAGEALGAGLSRLFSLMSPMPVTITGPGAEHYDLMSEGLAACLKDNLVLRSQPVPKISVIPDESQLVFSGNVQTSLGELDTFGNPNSEFSRNLRLA